MIVPEALSKVSKTVKELRLELATSFHERFSETTPLFPRIDSLTQFLHLTRLSINLRFFGDPPGPSDAEREVLERGAYFDLPETLEKLELIEFWHEMELAKQKRSPSWERNCILWSQSALFTMLTTAADARSGDPILLNGLPKLRELTFRATRPLHDHEPKIVACEQNGSEDPWDESSARYDLRQHKNSDFHYLCAVDEALIAYMWYSEGLADRKIFRNPGELGRSILSDDHDYGPPALILKTSYGIPMLARLFKEVDVDFHFVWQDWPEEEMAVKLGRHPSLLGIDFPL
ncbi:hypothetical protein GGR57DRAFT_272664 [Xylariaceae sp. FL1272]|nr:hypothetical protein GGR57DRAFT_272664 [Xylariaceae sp. FL1272]